MARAITEEEKQLVQTLVAKARVALNAIADYDQARVDRLIQAVGWALSNEKTFTRLSNMGVDESGLGDRAGRPGKRF
ncbi:MAG: aldehyde dehydrogenase, partial [Alphaproteobacteria bacterium]|nr:aldehyde dehydrogenase [Alphaproteobacteria bacterium]